jgi:uncharacterized protein YhbP (UPF0306 family)
MTEQVPQEVLDYLGAQKTLTLATSGLDGPWAATLTYVNSGSEIYIWTRPSSTTARHIDQNPTAAFAIDEYTEDWRQTKGIQGRGRCSPLDGEGIAKAADLFGGKYPQLRPGSTSAVMFFRIEPDSLEFISNAKGAERDDEFGAEYRRQSILDLPALDQEKSG